jgi:RNA polymerase sporulation-specific sigma factor
MASLDLIQKAVKGDARSITAIVEQYTPLVHKIVNKYAWMSPSHSREDLVQEGLLGVVKAIETFEPERGYRFMTWVYPQIRGAVAGVARKDSRHPRFPIPLESSDWAMNLEDPNQYEVRDEVLSSLIKDLVLTGCGGSTESKRAQIVCDRFGLLGHKALRQGEVAKKHGLTKQAVQSHLARFHKIIREKHPELEALIK